MSDKQIVLVRWIDSAFMGGWHTPGDVSYDPLTCHTVGWIAHEDDDVLALVSSKTSAGQDGGLMSIPKVCVVEVIKMMGTSSG